MTTGSSAAVQEQSTNPLAPPLPIIAWIQSMELGYEDKQQQQQQQSSTTTKANQQQVCFQCGKSEEECTNKKLAKCSQCQVATYCSRDCQVKNWKDGLGHKNTCQFFARVGKDMILKTDTDRIAAKAELYGRIRFYICPYAVYKYTELGPGFLFLQSDCTLAELSLPLPQTIYGHAMMPILRSVYVHYLTMGEYDTEICRDDFELAAVRTSLQNAMRTYEHESTVILLMRFRCGHVSLGTAPLVPDYGICQALGKEYYQDSPAGALQLNLDDI